MKILLSVIFSFLTLFCFGQTKNNNNALYNLTINYRPAVISIFADTGMLNSSINNGNIEQMTLTGMTPGQYKIQISGQGQQTITRDSIVIKKGQDLVLSFKFDGPCLYDRLADYIPTCPKNHTDSIIPIVYGLVTRKGDTFIKDKKDMKVKYAGCIVTGCDPNYYCKQHDIEF